VKWKTCSCERQQESSIAQALHLNNGQTLNDKLRDKKSCIEDWVKEKISDDEAIRVGRELAERSRQEVSLLEVRLDEREQLLGVRRLTRTQRDPCS